MSKLLLISPGPFFTSCIAILILFLFFYLSLKLGSSFLKNGKRIFFIVSAIILLRMVIPVNFSFTYTFYSETILPPIFSFLYCELPNTSIQLQYLLYSVWFIGASIQLSRFSIKKTRFFKIMKEFSVSKNSSYGYLYEIAEIYTEKPITIAIIPFTVSPGITGYFKPILFLSDVHAFSAQELKYIFAHELYHYKKNDLWLLLIMDIVCCIHWWNPLVYIMKKWFCLSMEISNDQMIMKEKDKKEYLNYASLILKISNMIPTSNSMRSVNALNFITKKNNNLKLRIHYLCNDANPSKDKSILNIIQVGCMFVLMIFSLFFVIEFESNLPKDDTSGTFSISETNSYFVESPNGYELYVDGKYYGLVNSIPDELNNLPIKNR